ncbi:DUF1836 domain-containing protein [Oceanobacillus alkalisoli]|uniref:DUF1836 domain-containing protein n=1 Tax=Oceanobacillus alkalisoli TaxID=2925113 RepID=UPI001EF078D3|nr:DUF1836 domain-containing protein [Oceanobacillus alkalisoli]MCF3943209.1 DUF1836 domain-containing protein [Oceanobacillus alkalisoli]MCG5103913.1 DUF1836 domain-containing protein [Oceanobacillus alkalisoli]
MENNLENLLRQLQLDTRLSSHDIPNLDLYMDQVIQLFEKKYEKTKRTTDEKILTKTMINNYSKGKLFFPIKNKKYSPEHVMLIDLIYEMKTILAIRDIKTTLESLNEQMMEETFNLESLYESFLKLSRNNLERFHEDSREIVEDVDAEQLSDSYLNKVLLILSFVNMSNYYRRSAEALVDEIVGKELKKD